MKRKRPMPSYYGKNIAQHAQKKFFVRQTREREAREREVHREKEGRIGCIVIGDEIGPAPGREELDRISNRP